MQTHNRKSFILCIYEETVSSNQEKEHFAYFLQSDHYGIITKTLNLTQS